MSLFIQKEESERRILFRQLPFPDSTKSVKVRVTKRRYEWLLEITRPRGWSLTEYLSLGLGLDTPIVEAIFWVLSSSKINGLLSLYSDAIKVATDPVGPFGVSKIIVAPFTNSYLSQFLTVNISDLSNKELAYWFRRLNWEMPNSSTSKHLRRLESERVTVFRGESRKIHEAVKKSLECYQRHYLEMVAI